MEVQLAGSDDTIELADTTFDYPLNQPLVHQVVTTFASRGHDGTRKQKNRSEVRGGGRKPYRQKGTGRARAGSIRSPLWRSGGMTFPARPIHVTQKVNRKMYRIAMRCILSELIRQDRIVIVADFSLESHKTKALLSKLSSLELPNVLIVTTEIDRNLSLAARNLKNVCVAASRSIDPISLLSYDKVLLTAAAARDAQEMLS